MTSRANVTAVLLVLWAILVATGGLLFAPEGHVLRLVALAAASAIVVVAVAGRIMGRWREPLLAGLLVTGVGVVTWGGVAGEPTVAVAGVLAVLLVGVAGVVCWQLDDLVGARASGTRAVGTHRLEPLLERIHEDTMLSDTAKRVLYRERELGLLRRVIENDIERGDYNAALRLCDDLANLFGYREEAESFRARLDRIRHDDHETQVRSALGQLDELLVARNWTAAHDIAARLRRLFPDSHVLDEIDHRIGRSRDEHKRHLEKAFLEAAQKEDVELAMELLRELDRYLAPEEAERLADLAQNVVARHRENLSVQFKLAVNDHRWADAARIGDAIIAEFPNTKMAEEVRSMIEVLRTRATQAAVAADGG